MTAASGDAGGLDRDPTVLVVDDEVRVGEAFELWLDDDYRVLTATGGEEALEVLSTDGAVDVVLLDRHMPGLSGDEVLDRIRAEGYDCRVAMVTAVDPDFDILEMPFDEYLSKPVDQADLREVVERLLDLSTYDRRVAELYSISQKRATLEVQMPESKLVENEEYAALLDRQEALRAELDEMADRLDAEEAGALFGFPGGGE